MRYVCVALKSMQTQSSITILSSSNVQTDNAIVLWTKWSFGQLELILVICGCLINQDC